MKDNISDFDCGLRQNMQSTADPEGKLNEDTFAIETLFLPVTSVNDEVIALRFLSPAASCTTQLD